MPKRGPTWLALIALALAAWAAQDVLRGLWEPDEARYAYVAREMRWDDRWAVPHLHGEPYPDKPPLLFWLINAASLLTGGEINNVSARLPSFAGALLVLWVTARLTERWADGPTAWRAVLVLLTSYLFWQEGGWGRTDALLCGLEMLSVYFFFSYSDRGRAWQVAAAYVCAGLAVLAKGPVGLAVPIGVYVAGSWAAGEARKLRRWHWTWGTAVALVFPAAWLLCARWADAPRDYFTAMFTTKSFGRAVQDTAHPRPIYYFLTHFPVEFLPWTIFLPAAFVATPAGPLRRRLLAWGLFVLGLFSLFHGKRNIYVLMAYPAAAMLVATGWSGLVRLSPRWRATGAYAAIGFLVLLGVGALGAGFAPQMPLPRWVLLPSALVLLLGAAALVRAFRGEGLTDRWLGLLAGTMLALYLTVSLFALPAMNPLKAPVELAAEAHASLPADQPVYLYREQLAIVPLYAHRPGRLLRNAAELHAAFASHPDGVVVFARDDWEDVRSTLSTPAHAREFRMGNKKLVWVEFSSARQP